MNKLFVLSLLLTIILLSGCSYISYNDISDKMNICIELCVGENKDIPFVINQCKKFCQMLYESEGLEGLDKQIKSYETTTTIMTTTIQ